MGRYREVGLFEAAGGFIKSRVNWYYQPKKQVITIHVFVVRQRRLATVVFITAAKKEECKNEKSAQGGFRG